VQSLKRVLDHSECVVDETRYSFHTFEHGGFDNSIYPCGWPRISQLQVMYCDTTGMNFLFVKRAVFLWFLADFVVSINRVFFSRLSRFILFSRHVDAVFEKVLLMKS